jgi:O-antigen biosynthesis protein
VSHYVVIHPEGNVNNNPCLHGMVTMLCDQGNVVRILSPRRHDIPQPPVAGAELCLFTVPDSMDPATMDRWSADEFGRLRNTFVRCAGSPDLVIGVDRGVIAGALIATTLRLPLALLSFEIFFADEAGPAFKDEEKTACSHVALAVCQDELRAAHLARENAIASSLIRCVPVSGRGYKGGEKTRYWHQRFGIAPNERIALFMGSIAEWSMAPYLLESASGWSSDWHLVMHHRYSPDPWVQQVRAAYIGRPRIHFSDAPFETIAEMRPALLGADVGIALYQPLGGRLHEGHNLEFIGMASGKIAVYLQHGLPVAVNEIGEMSRYVRERDCGVIVDTSKPWVPMVAVNPEAIRDFFSEVLDLDTTFSAVAEELQTLCRSGDPAAPIVGQR